MQPWKHKLYRGIILCGNPLAQKSTLTTKLFLSVASWLNVEHRKHCSLYITLFWFHTDCQYYKRTLLSQLGLSSFCETYHEVHRNRMTYTSKVILAPLSGYNIHISISFAWQNSSKMSYFVLITWHVTKTMVS